MQLVLASAKRMVKDVVNKMTLIYSLAGTLTLLSFIKDRSKTKKALAIAVKIFFMNMLPMLLSIVAVVSIMLYLLPDHVIAKYLGNSGNGIGVVIGLLIGSISLLPGFITFPLSGLLLRQGVSFVVLGAFTTTLMMVGIITFPMERKFFGTKLALYRNIAGFIIAVIVSLCIGLVYGEVI